MVLRQQPLLLQVACISVTLRIMLYGQEAASPNVYLRPCMLPFSQCPWFVSDDNQELLRMQLGTKTHVFAA